MMKLSKATTLGSHLGVKILSFLPRALSKLFFSESGKKRTRLVKRVLD